MFKFEIQKVMWPNLMCTYVNHVFSCRVTIIIEYVSPLKLLLYHYWLLGIERDKEKSQDLQDCLPELTRKSPDYLP